MHISERSNKFDTTAGSDPRMLVQFMLRYVLLRNGTELRRYGRIVPCKNGQISNLRR